MKKGSPEAIAWGKKMKAAKIRSLGQQREQEFFGESGVITHAEALKAAEAIAEHEKASIQENPIAVYAMGNPGEKITWQTYAGGIGAPEGKNSYAAYLSLGEYHIDVVTTRLGRFVGYRVMFANNKGALPGGLWHGPLYQASFRTAGAAKKAAARHYAGIVASGATPYKGPEENPRKVDVVGYMREKGWMLSVGSRVDPRVFSRFAGGMTQVIQREAQGWRLLTQDRGKLQTSQVSAGVFPLLTDATIRADKMATKENPGKRRSRPLSGHISAKIEGVVYNRCLEIRAEKTTHKPGYYRHPFSRRSGVQILALDNGDLLIHSTRGIALWGEDK